jgi:hypothetical protein
MPNPTGKGGWKRGQSGNPGGRRAGYHVTRTPQDPPPPKTYRPISDICREARGFAELALHTLVDICRCGSDRDRLAAATQILDRGFGKPLQMIDAAILTKKLTELSATELDALQARLLTEAAALPPPAPEAPA